MVTQRRVPRLTLSGLLTLVLLAALLTGADSRASAAVLPTGFTDTIVITGRTEPTSVSFAPNGAVIVTEKAGKVWSYSSLADSSPTLVADLTTQTQGFWDRGLLGLAIPPNYPTDNHLYVLYTFDAAIGGTAPRWGDNCPDPPGATTDGCVVSSRLSRLTISGGVSTNEQVLINDWCQQFPSHSIGTLAFGPDGYLYAGAGDGANFNAVDFGQFGGATSAGTVNPCGDPPGGPGTALAPPSAEGGMLRSQSPRRANGPTTLDGAILRLDPATGRGAPGNPFATSTDANKARILAYGLRNPFRFTHRPGTRELWVGDVGWGTWEEINRVADTASGTAQNFGWPCYEGVNPLGSVQQQGLASCTNLYNNPGSVTSPYFSYRHDTAVGTGDGCATTKGSSVSGAAFYQGGAYPTTYNGALFFADVIRGCIWAMMPNASGNPDPTKINAFAPASSPVDLKIGPSGDLFYVDISGGSIHRVVYTAGNTPPSARMTATPTSGDLPLTVAFDGSTSTDPENAGLTYSWSYGDGSTGTGARSSHVYSASGTYTAVLKVTDPGGLSSTASTTITAGNVPPTVTAMNVQVIDRDSGAVLPRYKVGDRVRFSASATGSSGQPLPAAAFTWELAINHGEHTHHNVGVNEGTTSGSQPAPDHSYPCHLVLTLTVTDPTSGLTTSRSTRIDPQTVALTFKSNPGGLRITLASDEVSKQSPFTVTAVVRHAVSVAVSSPQIFNGQTYTFQSWSDGGAMAHNITSPATATTYTATFRKK